MEGKMGYCYLTYVIPMEHVPEVVPTAPVPPAADVEDFVPQWFLNARFPEDEEWDE